MNNPGCNTKVQIENYIVFQSKESLDKQKLLGCCLVPRIVKTTFKPHLA